MSESKHTPGPWEFDGENIMSPISLDYICIMRTDCDEEQKPTVQADASLIATAPELLEMVEAIAMVHDLKKCIGPVMWNMLAAIIAKAKGGA